MSDERKGKEIPTNWEFDLMDLYERLLRGETSPAGKRRKLRELLARYKQLLQQKPEIDNVEKYVEEKARELVDASLFYDIDGARQYSIAQGEARKFISQIISEVRGRET